MVDGRGRVQRTTYATESSRTPSDTTCPHIRRLITPRSRFSIMSARNRDVKAGGQARTNPIVNEPVLLELVIPDGPPG